MKRPDNRPGPFRVIIPLTRALLLDINSRRRAMFYTVVAAALMMTLGATFLSDWLLANRRLFVAYWLCCAWLTVLSMLLALYDLLILRLQARRAQRDLREKVKREIGNATRP